MELTPERIGELSALATILLVFLVAVWRGVPQLIAYLERKDTAHREEIRHMIEDSRAERDVYLERTCTSLDRIHIRLDSIETTVRNAKQGVLNG